MPVIRVAHSPDTDDVFMFWAIATGAIDTGDRRYELHAEEVGRLNVGARDEHYDVTAISFGAYPALADRYALAASGASIGDGYGPIVVARTPCILDDLGARSVAVPGKTTTARLVLRLARPDLVEVELPFDDVIPAVRDGDVDAGVLIHEGQLTWQREGLHRILDLGEWWRDEEGGPLPLGANAIRRSLVDREAVAGDLRRSIEAALEQRDEARAWTIAQIEAQGGRGMTEAEADRYLRMYVNDETVSLSETTRQSVRRLFERARAAGLIDADVPVDFVEA